MKSIIVYFSLEGHTKYIAEMIAKETGADIFELRPVKKLDKTGFARYFWGGKSVFFNEKPELEYPMPDLSTYDVIFIGTPVWASSFAPPVNTFIINGVPDGKTLMLFSSHAGGGAVKCFDKIRKRLIQCKTAGEISFTEPSVSDEERIEAEIRGWLKGAGL